MLLRASPSQVYNLSEILFFHLKPLVRLSCPRFILQQHLYITFGEPFPNNSSDLGELERDVTPLYFYFFLTKECNSPGKASPICWFSDSHGQSELLQKVCLCSPRMNLSDNVTSAPAHSLPAGLFLLLSVFLYHFPSTMATLSL